jgi:hypothetical protein
MRGHTRRRARLDALVLLLILLLGLAHEARSQCPNNAQLPAGASQWPSCACSAGYTNTSGLVNLARACSAGGCTVTGISEFIETNRWAFSRLVDGQVVGGSFSGDNGAHTNTKNNDWMMIDLEQTAFINHVQIFNRVACCGFRLNNFQIRVGHSSTFSNNPACVTGEPSFDDVKNFSCVLSGRYLSIQQFNTEAMNLRELEVYGRKTSNLARACSAGNCPVTGISELGGWELSRAVDGITSSGGAHTLSQQNDWLMIDMQQTVFVAMVRIYNRQECCQDRINNFQIRVGDSGTSAGSSNPACASNQPWFTNPNNKDFICVLSGRYVTLQQFNSHWMNVAEVEVYGLKALEWCTACAAGYYGAKPLEYSFLDVYTFEQFVARVASIPGATTTMNYWQGNYGAETHGAYGHPGDGEISIPLPATHNQFVLDVWEVMGLYWDSTGYIEVVLQGSMPKVWTVSYSTVEWTSTQIVSRYNEGSVLKIREVGAAIVSKYLKLKLEDGSCFGCSANTYSATTGATAASTCQSCPSNSQSATGSDAATDCVCLAGFSGPDGGTCAACLAGKYKTTAGSAACTDCPLNSYHALTERTAASACQCNAGTRCVC